MIPHPADGYAFPFADPYHEHGDLSAYPGMTLLDYFAAAAMRGLLAQHRRLRSEYEQFDLNPAYPGWSESESRFAATHAYDIAEAMLEERNRRYLEQLRSEV